MKNIARMMAVAVVAGIAGVGALALMTPAVANVVTHPMSWVAGDDTGPGSGRRMGHGAGNEDGNRDGTGREGPGMGNRGAMGADECLISEDQGTLTEEQRATLAGLAAEEQLAHDLYVAFGDRYDVVVFDRIARAEEMHLDALRTLMDRYEVTDPTAGKTAGTFADAEVRATYDRLLAEGSKDLKAAHGVAVTVERTDIDDLNNALDGLTAPDAKQVYTNLAEASERHLATFEAWATR